MATIPPPNATTLLPPLLACLPLSFVSPRPPPDLLPLLSPLLRQRLTYLSTSNSSSPDGWLSLLSWQGKSTKLPAAVERMQLDPHPVSGEIEVDDTVLSEPKFRRLDQETLHARLRVEQFDLLPTYVWCENDEHGQTGAGWKLADLKSLEELDEREDEAEWYESVAEANEAAGSHQASKASAAPPVMTPAADDDDDDDYWGAYDRTPGQTPATHRSPAPPSLSRNSDRNGGRDRTQSEVEYFARYGEEVQPALDAHDPDEESEEVRGSSSLTGDALVREQARQLQSSQTAPPPLYTKQGLPHDSAVGSTLEQSLHGSGELSMPRPISPADSNSSIERLEQEAAAMSGSGESDRATNGIKQHISTDIKSLYRLAKSVGMERAEFQRIVRTELEVLSLLDQDD